MEKIWKKRKPFMFIFIIIGFALLIGLLMLLWNAVLPAIIGVAQINYWQALGIFILSKILFGFNFGPSRSKMIEHRAGIREKFINMTDEEKEAFKEKWKAKWKNHE